MKKHLRPISNVKRKRSQGFLKRMSSRGGRNVVNQRRRKGRRRLAPV